MHLVLNKLTDSSCQIACWHQLCAHASVFVRGCLLVQPAVQRNTRPANGESLLALKSISLMLLLLLKPYSPAAQDPHQ